MIEKNWKDLFIVNLVQWMVPIHLISDKDILSTFERINRQQLDSQDQSECLENFKLIKEIVFKLINLNLDSNELDHFKILFLLRTGKTIIKEFKNISKVNNFFV